MNTHSFTFVFIILSLSLSTPVTGRAHHAHAKVRKMRWKEDETTTMSHGTELPVHMHESLPQAPSSNAQLHQHSVQMSSTRSKSLSHGFSDNSLLDAGDAFSQPSTMNSHVSPIVVGHAVTVIIVVCAGFLVFMVVLGVIRIRAAHRRTTQNREEEQEMAWDDTALTITVNPLDQFEQESAGSHVHEEEEESDSSGGSYREDGESSDEDAPQDVSKQRGMTWDDAALNF